MIDASFDKLSRKAAIDGVYQYDTGQRLRLSGLPSPEELGEADEMLTGELPAMQVHFGYLGDTQTEYRLAEWDEDRYAWMVSVPDGYFVRSEQVNVYVYVSYGSDEGGSRNKTMYEGTFTPISRPAPNNVVSEDQHAIWENLEQEVNLVLSSANTATQNALVAVEPTRTAADVAAQTVSPTTDAANRASAAAERLHEVERMFSNLNVRAVTLAAGSAATATLQGDVLTFGIPRGQPGNKGDDGDAELSDITMSLKDGILTITPK